MEKIYMRYKDECKKSSDINEHLPVLLKYSKECKHITEMGVRWGSSTFALLSSNPHKMISYDILEWSEIDEIIKLTKEYNIDYEFIKSDVLNVEIEPTDLLFIDTLHTYNQLISELNLHSKKVSKYIILHDTSTFAFHDEGIYEHSSVKVKNLPVSKSGLLTAVHDFLKSDIGSNWVIFEDYKNNNGLLILKKSK